jgi:antitoxin (DNA-binding transcriptional repressor) of toxin-antitoxin stability system
MVIKKTQMKKMSKSRLKSHMLQVFREIEADGETLYVTDHGRPVLKIEPVHPRTSLFEAFGGFQGQVVIPDDALEPEWEEWENFL